MLVVGAILGYPLYYLVRLSFQKYGLFELIQHHGTPVGWKNYSSVLHDSVFWHVLLRTVVFTVANVFFTIVGGTLIALLLTKVSSVVRDPAHGRPRARVGDAAGRRGAGLALDDELPERRPQLRR